MHVAHFVHRYPPALGGAESYCARLSRYLVSHGDTVTVWTSTARDLEAMRHRGFRETDAGDPAPGVAVQRFCPLRFPLRRYVLKALSLAPVPPWQARLLPCNPVMPAMARAARNYAGPLDAVHAFAFPYSFPAAVGLALARRRGVPFALTPFLHLGDPADPRDRTRRQYTSRPLRWLLHAADLVFAQTPGERAFVRSLGVPAGRVVLQGLGVDAAECAGGDRLAARALWGLAPDTVAVGHLANQSVEKGTVDLLAAVAELPPEARGRLKLVLAGPRMPNFDRAFAAFAHPECVVQLGPLSDGEKRDFFAGIDLFALPSRSDSFGLVLLEAWANGVPNLAYRAGGPGDLIRDGVDGLLAPCGDVGELARQLGRLAASAELRASLGSTGRARLAGEFDWAAKLGLVRAALRGSASGTGVPPVF